MSSVLWFALRYAGLLALTLSLMLLRKHVGWVLSHIIVVGALCF